MEFHLEKAREQFYAGQFASIAHSIGPTTPHIRHLSMSARSILAHTLVYTGRLGLASQLANSIDESDSPISARAEARIALGLLRKREGRIDDACAEFQVAARLAREGRDSRLFLGSGPSLPGISGRPLGATRDRAIGRSPEERVQCWRPTSCSISSRFCCGDGGPTRSHL
jgi:hypothetical protein